MNPLESATNQKQRNRKRSGTGTRKDGKNSLQEEDGQERPSLEESTSEDMELDNLSDDGLQDDEETGLTGKDRGRRKQRRRRNTLLDQRIVGDVKVTAEEKKEADRDVLKKSLVNALLIGLWYTFSLSISIVSCVCILADPAQLESNWRHSAVQQMDVRPETPRFSLPSLHNMFPHACTIFIGISSTILSTTFPTTIRFYFESPQYTCCGWRAGTA